MPDPARTFLPDPISEQLLQSLVALAAEVSVLRERVARLEAARDGGSPQPLFAEAESFVTSVFGGIASLPARTPPHQ